MTPQEVVWFFNHKHGERAYLVETEQYLQIFTSKSKWKIIKDDYRRFKQYTLYHFSTRAGQGYHKQMNGRTLEYLVYCACCHDETETYTTPKTWNEFCRLYDMYCYGREIEERANCWDWLCGKELCYA